MPAGLLVSVRDAQEALAALEGGAHVIDVKEPAAGPLGCPTPAQVAEVLMAVGKRRPVSVALGELGEIDRSPWRDIVNLPGVAFAKIGMARMRTQQDWRQRMHAFWASFPAGVKPVAVIYTDYQRAHAPPPRPMIAAARHGGARAVLLDTFDKAGPGVLAALGAIRLARWVERIQAAGMVGVVGGKVAVPDVASLVAAGVDLVAVRSGVCTAGRQGAVSEILVRQYAAALCPAPSSLPGWPPRRIAAR